MHPDTLGTEAIRAFFTVQCCWLNNEEIYLEKGCLHCGSAATYLIYYTNPHIQHALETGFISPEEADQLIHYNVQRFDSMLTDIFDHELEQTLDLKNPYNTKASDIQP